jgi:hypothetical protein
MPAPLILTLMTTTNNTPNTKTGYVGRDNRPEVGDFVVQTLVTDSIAYEVVKVTEHTVTLRHAGRGEDCGRRDNGSPYPVIYTEIVPSPGAPEVVCRYNKSLGHICPQGGRSARFAPLTEDGVPYTVTDWSF